MLSRCPVPGRRHRPLLQGRFRVGVEFDAGKVAVSMDEGVSPDGERISKRLLELAREVLTVSVNRRYGEFLQKLESFEVREGNLHFAR